MSLDISNRAFRMTLMAIVNGLREGGQLSDDTIEAIARNLREAATPSNGVVYNQTDAPFFMELARAIEVGDDGAGCALDPS
ncbi:hypothetical protein [Sphingopyxis granuli]|uniref:hypothetical protein n=1 Tax=Sphingopyxis granuli TaxID=267128 RepID=UPI00082997FC|nr:hypothetical protein [Sphingopyxis granuli]